MTTCICTASALTIRSLPVVGAGTDTGKRMIKGQVAQVWGFSEDGASWLYVDAPAGRGWCSREYLEVGGEVPDVPPPSWPKVPSGRAGIERIFGSPGSAMANSGRVTLPAPLKLGWSPEAVTRVGCHKLMEDVFGSVFARLYEKGLWFYLHTFDGIYNDRTVTASQKVSTHAWGISIDLNASSNPLGGKSTMEPRIVAVFRDHGFVWGGEWSRPDPMHFQYATDY